MPSSTTMSRQADETYCANCLLLTMSASYSCCHLWFTQVSSRVAVGACCMWHSRTRMSRLSNRRRQAV